MAMGRRYDDEDDDDRDRAPAGDSGGMTAVKILAVIGFVVLGVTLVCGGVGAFGIWMAVTAADRARQDVMKRADQIMQEQIKQQKEMEQQMLREQMQRQKDFERKMFEKR
jgi:hypothetical protein